MRRARRAFAVAMALLLLPTALGSRPVGASPPPDAEAPRPFTQSASSLLLDLRKQRVELERRASELEAREHAIAEAERELQRRIDDFEEVRVALEQRLERLEETLGDETARLSKTYAAMPPDRAAALMESLDLVLASSILRTMRYKQSAAVLASMDPDRARTLSQRLARPFASDGTRAASDQARRGGQR